MTLSNEAVHDTLRHAIIEYDKRESSKKSYNPYALGICIEALQSAMKFINAGADAREVILGHFCGRLLAQCLKALRMAPATFEEENGRGVTRRDNYKCRYCCNPITEHAYECIGDEARK